MQWHGHLQVVRGQMASAASPGAEQPVPCLYDILWQAAEAAPLSSHKRTFKSPPRISWHASSSSAQGKENKQLPPSFGRGRLQQSSYPAREALRSVAWLQSAVRNSKPRDVVTLQTRGVLTFPQLPAPAGTPTSKLQDARHFNSSSGWCLL